MAFLDFFRSKQEAELTYIEELQQAICSYKTSVENMRSISLNLLDGFHDHNSFIGYSCMFLRSIFYVTPEPKLKSWSWYFSRIHYHISHGSNDASIVKSIQEYFDYSHAIEFDSIEHSTMKDHLERELFYFDLSILRSDDIYTSIKKKQEAVRLFGIVNDTCDEPLMSKLTAYFYNKTHHVLNEIHEVSQLLTSLQDMSINECRWCMVHSSNNQILRQCDELFIGHSASLDAIPFVNEKYIKMIEQLTPFEFLHFCKITDKTFVFVKKVTIK